MDYDLVFTKRASEYNYATTTYPDVLVNELMTAAQVVDAKPGEVIVNVPGACDDISPYFMVDVTYKSYETNKMFASVTCTTYSEFGIIPEPNESVDKVVSIAALHHSTDAERQVFYNEVLRILKPGGVMIIGDVMSGSSQDAWLNTFVNKYNGHNGKFWSVDDTKLMQGFNVNVKIKKYMWSFNGKDEMIDFIRNLFGIGSATDSEISDGLRHYLGETDNKFEWSLIYFIATKISNCSLPL